MRRIPRPGTRIQAWGLGVLLCAFHLRAHFISCAGTRDGHRAVLGIFILFPAPKTTAGRDGFDGRMDAWIVSKQVCTARNDDKRRRSAPQKGMTRFDTRARVSGSNPLHHLSPSPYSPSLCVSYSPPSPLSLLLWSVVAAAATAAAGREIRKRKGDTVTDHPFSILSSSGPPTLCKKEKGKEKKS
ncbi:hypothetical protein GGS23DRAFT_540260 [Durotheca rogersii]|uniref:uncharacterized protein n=1 Tax=Durotheca rogersii TaxID=419775 RepID=UPI0022209FE7|nr:uncharacterized protein GGS23DRAFT_540260 [Durotheca rogersii]KAI5863577.1 hypothetical protein GGS23DRAFT_540260 [Durotheca rogersii]